MQDQLANKIESLLFFQAEPIKINKLVDILNSNNNDIDQAIELLGQKLSDSGIRLIRNDNTISLTTSPENSEIIEKIKKEEEDRELSKAALETLTIILYRGPIKRSGIDYIRGVNSQFSLRSLLVKGLIEREVYKDDERTYVYKATLDLLSYLGISKTEDLPDHEKVNNDINNFIETEKEKNEDE